MKECSGRFFHASGVRGAVRIENNSDWNFKDLEEIVRGASIPVIAAQTSQARGTRRVHEKSSVLGHTF